jgi:hypothetical protein
MQEIVGPIAALIKWSFDNILVPIGDLPDLINPNYLFLFLGFIGMFYWLFLQGKYNKQAANDPNQIK